MSTTSEQISRQDWAAQTFEVRQATWDGSFLRSFRQLNREGRPGVWEIWVEGDVYRTRHGLLGGKMQETSKRGKTKNKGRSNELTPSQDALAEARRLCRKKWDFEGYDEFLGDINIDGRAIATSIPCLLADLPSSFSLYKPANILEECKGLSKKVARGECIYTLKRNGLAVWAVVDSTGVVHIYSRRNRKSHKDEGPRELPDGTLTYDQIVPWNTRFPHLVAAVHAWNPPPNSMFACELVSRDGDTKKHFSYVQSIEKSLTHRALELQKEHGWLGLYLWDVPFFDGQDLVKTLPVKSRHNLIKQLHLEAEERGDPMRHWIQPITMATCQFNSPEEAVAYAEEHEFEGWVVLDPEGVYGEKGWNLNGKPNRPSSYCAKLKPWYEDDFIVWWVPEKKWGTYGKGRHEKGKSVTLPDGSVAIHGGVGSVGLFQYNSEGEMIYICDCSSGMDYAFQAKLRLLSFPMVWEVKYVDRSYISEGGKTNALTHPKLSRIRTDKAPEECINDKL